MKKMTMTTAAILLSGILAISMTGCSGSTTTNTAANNTASSSVSDISTDYSEDIANDAAATESTQKSGDTSVTAETVSFTGSSDGMIDTSSLFTERDLTQTADLSEATSLTISDGQDLTITEAGVYVLSGTASECTIIVDAADDAKVQLVLDGVSITNSDFPAIYVKNADKVFVTTTSGSENSLSVTGQFTADGDTNTDAVIFSKDDLVLNGLGTLNIVSSYGNGISAKDDLKVTGGTYTIKAAEDAAEANDSVAICGGSFTITAGKDGFHCENDTYEGYIYIADGSFNISASDDGVQATTILQIDGGTFTVTASEGLEATYIQINDGDLTISASDDGVNAANKSTAYTPTIEVNGGEISVTMGSGDVDGFDANGNITINGGTINVTIAEQGMAEAFDFDGTGTINGGAVYVNGEQITEITSSMMGGGMMGGFGGNQGGFGGQDNSNGQSGWTGRGGRMM